MRERKYVKFRVDMYDDTKFKIIDRRPERDLIHYIWNRLVVLAGKVNLDGELYFSKNLPHTIETLSIEFNRGVYEVKSAIDVLLELQMLELTEDKGYKVKNFAKHQNIKPKEKIEAIEENKIANINENMINQKDVEEVKSASNVNSEVANEEVRKIDNNVSKDLLSNTPIIFKASKNKKVQKGNKIDWSIQVTDEAPEDPSMATLIEGDEALALAEGQDIVGNWLFQPRALE